MDERIGPYRIDRELGRGGMGVVYLARDERLDRFVAIKALPEEVAEDASRLSRFRREARIIAQLNHPHIAQIHHLLEHDSRTYLVLEYITGHTLATRLSKGGLDLESALRICAQVARALEAAHQKSVIHRDLKPGNIMVTEDGAAKVLDFGLAVSSEQFEPLPNATTVRGVDTQPDRIIGSPGYMSPEQARGKPVDQRADLFAFGCVLYECLCGRPAFSGSTTADMLAATLREEANLAHLPSGVDEPVRNLVRRCLAKPIESRQQSAGDARIVLEESAGLSSSRSSRITSPAETPSNLPRQRTTFVGREHELQQIVQLLRDASLVTLTGSGGCGKTRLALRTAELMIAHAPAGCCFVDLAPVVDPELVDQACAEALGLSEPPGSALLATITAHLQSRDMLLVVDNCEHLLHAASRLIDAILNTCPDTRVIATSREALGIQGERTCRVPSLSLPEPGRSNTNDLLECEAVRLFVDRASSTNPGFALNEANAEAVATICRRLDGIPLAIELAAARMKALTAPQIAQRLDDRFRLLTGGSRTSLPRQQTLRATIDWSYEQLGPAERALLRSLGVFIGGWTLESATAVCADDDMGEFQILDLLTRLIDKSMVLVDHQGEDARYRLLETVRQYAREKLLEAGEGPALRDRHLAHFLQTTDEATDRLSGPDQEQVVEALERDHDNYRAAIDWAIGEHRAEDALRLVSGLSHFWSLHSHHAEALHHFESALNVPGADPSALRGAVLCRASWCALVRGQMEHAEDLAQRGFKMARDYEDLTSVVVACITLGALCINRNDCAGAIEHFTASLEASRRLGSPTGEASGLNNLAEVHFVAGDYDRARQFSDEALALIRRIGNPHLEGWTLSCQGAIATAQGQFGEARALFRGALTLLDRVGSARHTHLVLARMACLHSAEDSHERAAQLFGACDALTERRRFQFEQQDHRYHEKHRLLTRDALGTASFETLHAGGMLLSEDEAFSLAFGTPVQTC